MQIQQPPKTGNPFLDVWLQRLVHELEPYLIAAPVFTGQGTIPTINLTGGQIAFPATAVPSADPNTLDDYEEGTWTVTITCGTSGTITLQAGEQTGGYTKIGRVVHVHGFVDVDSTSSPLGTAMVSLPFTCGNLTEEAGTSVGSVAPVNVAWAGDMVVCYVVENTQYFRILELTTNASSGYVDGADFAADDNIFFGLTYVT